RGISLAADSALIANVLPQTNSLLLITKSFGLSNERSLLPLAWKENSPPGATIVRRTLASSDLSALFIDADSCATPFDAPTPMMQSPRGVRCRFVVTSMVLACVDLTME